MTKEISLRPAHFQNFHKGSENAVIESERLPGWVSFATIFLSKRRRRSLFHGSAPHEASVGRVPQKILRTILAPEEPISANPTVKEHTSDSPTVDVGPAANLRAGLAAADFPGRPYSVGRIRPAPGSCRARALLSLYVCHAAVTWRRQPSCCGTGPGCPPPPARWPEPPVGWR